MTSNADPENSQPDDAPSLDERDRDLDALCEGWVSWCRERRLYWPAPKQVSAIVRRGGGTRPLRSNGAASRTAASMAAFHIAYTCQPDSLDKQVFDLYYVARVTPIKSAAAALGIGRSHFYRVLVEFRRRIDSAARAFQENGTDAGRLLTASHDVPPVVNTESVPRSGDNADPHV